MALARALAAAPVPVGAPAPPAAAATTAPKTATPGAVLIGYGLIAVAWAAAYGLWRWRQPTPFHPAADFSIFAPLYIFAQAIERFVEPFSSFIGGADAPDGSGKVDKHTAVTRLYEACAAPDQHALTASWQDAVTQIRKNRAVIVWGIASALGILASGAFGVFLVRAIGFDIPPQVDMAVTGIAIGSGTKPLHDLISNLQRSKEKKEDPKETGGTV